MLNRDFAGTTARIASTTNITPVEQVDYAGALKNFLNEYRTSADRYEKQKDKELLKSKTDALTNAIKGGNQDEINNALATVDPVAYAQMLKSDAQRAEDRKWALDDATTKYLRDLEIAKIKNNGLVNINMSNPLDKKRIETIGKNMDANIEESQARVNDYNRMEQLLNNPNVTTGGLKGFASENLPDWALNPETVELRSIIKKIVPQMRPAGSGTTSDRDMKIFEQATVGLGKDKDANLNIVRGRKVVDENNIAREELRYQWLTNGGSLSDFDKQWRNYLNSNPIFASEDGKLNDKRVNAYDWFSKPQAPSLKNFNQDKEEQTISDGTVIEDANGNKMILRGGQWQAM
jgi:hypothetical protein